MTYYQPEVRDLERKNLLKTLQEKCECRAEEQISDERKDHDSSSIVR